MLNLAFADLWMALRVRWRVEALVAGVILAVLGLTIFLMPKTYIATSSLFFDDQTSEPINGSQAKAGSLIATQADVVKSASVASAVAKQIGLLNDTTALNRWRKATGGVGDPGAWLGQALLPALDVTPVPGSNVLSISYRSNDPQFSALVANAFATAFVDERLNLRIGPAKTYSKWFEQQSADARQKLEAAQRRMTEFQREHGIVDDGTFNAETALLSEYLHAKAGTDSSAAEAQAIASNGNATGQVQDSPVVQGLRAQIAAKTAELSQMATAYGPNHPTMVAARAQLGELQVKLNDSKRVAMGVLQAATSSTVSHKADLDRLVSSQRGRIIDLSNNRARYDLLRKDADSARAQYDQVIQKLSERRLESDLPRANVRQLDEAQPPQSPSSPNVPLLSFLAVLLALMGGVTVGALLEWFYPRVRTAEGFEESTGVPVVVRFDFRKSSIRTFLEEQAA